MNMQFRFIAGVVGLSLTLLVPAAKADINAMCTAGRASQFPCTASSQVPVGQTRTVNVIWRGELEGATYPATIRSNGGRFILPGNNPVTLGTTFATVQTTVNSGVNFQIAESVQVPASVTQQAHEAGQTTVIYRRDFSESPNGDTIIDRDVVIPMSPPVPGSQPGTGPEPPDGGPGDGGAAPGQASSLQINRLALRFDNDDTLRVVARGEETRAAAYINYTNAGLFSGTWEIATPETTQGEPVFRPLTLTRRYLGVGREAVLQSPELPSDSLGLYLLRLRIDQPDAGFEPPVIRYMVRSEGAEEAFKPEPVSLDRPAEGAPLGGDTVFRWSSIRGAKAYQLELYEKPFNNLAGVVPRNTEKADAAENEQPARQQPSTGIVVPGNRSRLQLSAMVRQHLAPGRTYHWRIIAVNGEGRIIGVSPLREIRIP